MSDQLTAQGIEHVVLEKNTVAHTWKTSAGTRSALVTPNWQCQLPGYPYDGGDPHGFMRVTRSSLTSRISPGTSCAGPRRCRRHPPQANGRGLRSRRRRRDNAGTRRARRQRISRAESSRGWPTLDARSRAPLLRLPQSGSVASGRDPGGSAAASRAARSPRTCIWPAARCIWRSAARRAARASIAAVTQSTGLTTSASMICPSTSIR